MKLLTFLLALPFAAAVVMSNPSPPSMVLDKSVDVCAVAHKGSDYLDCNFDRASYNACNCYYSGGNKEEMCKPFLEGAEYCGKKCSGQGSQCVPQPRPKVYGPVCNFVSQGAVYKNCDYQWGIYNACNCYFKGDRATVCGFLKTDAAGCDTACERSGNCEKH